MLNTNCENIFIYDPLIKDKPEVVVLEDSSTTQKEIKQVITENLDWPVILVDNQEKAIKLCEENQVRFYILDIHLGERRTQEGLNTAEIIKKIERKTFVSILSGYPNPDSKKWAKRIGVDLFEEKGHGLKEGTSKITLAMLLYQDKIIDSMLSDCFDKNFNRSSQSADKSGIKKLLNKKKDICQKLERIYNLERLLDQTENLLDLPKQDLLKVYMDQYIKEDVNINAYERLKEDTDWFQKYQGKYVAFADGEWLKDYISDNSDDLLTNLRKSKEYKDKSVFYIQVQELQQDDSIMELPMSLLF